MHSTPRPYTEARPEITSGDILAVKGTWLFSRLVRWWTGSEVSHVGIAMWIRVNGIKRCCIVEAMEGYGVRIQPLSNVIKEYGSRGGKVWWLPVKKEIDRSNILSFALDHWGDEYASRIEFLSIISPGIRWLKRKFGVGEKLPFFERRWHCSEYTTRALVHGGVVRPDKSPLYVTPDDVTKFDCYSGCHELTEKGVA